MLIINKEEITKNLIEYIENNPISVTRLAAMMDLTFTTLDNIIKGNTHGIQRVNTWLKIAKFLRENK